MELTVLLPFLFLVVSAFYAECLRKKIQFNAHIWTKSKFLGMSIGVHNIGQGKTLLQALRLSVNFKYLPTTIHGNTSLAHIVQNIYPNKNHTLTTHLPHASSSLLQDVCPVWNMTSTTYSPFPMDMAGRVMLEE